MEIDVVQLELVKKYKISINSEDGYVYGVETVGKIFAQEIGSCNVEMVGVICLDNTNKIINYSNIAIGGIENVHVPVAQIFKVALLSNATQFIIAHNHPSGVLKITKADIELTRNIGIIAKVFDMKLIDSLVVNSIGEIISIRENIKELE